jgi:hypothetical protein
MNSKNYSHRNLISDSQLVGDSSIDAKIRRLSSQAADIRESYQFVDKGARRPDLSDLPVPRHFKTKHENGTKSGAGK